MNQHRMFNSCTHMATAGVKGLNYFNSFHRTNRHVQQITVRAAATHSQMT